MTPARRWWWAREDPRVRPCGSFRLFLAGMAAVALAGCASPEADETPQGAAAGTAGAAPAVAIVVDEVQRRAEVTVDGQPFTAYIWPETLEKPTLYPIRTASGTVVTRSFPPLDHERQDHPHHV